MGKSWPNFEDILDWRGKLIPSRLRWKEHVIIEQFGWSYLT
jgi:hypothetical protein